MKIHEKYIKRCLEIAGNNTGFSAPNPTVGAVIIHNDKIISEGFTSKHGGPHAEVNAINNVKDKSLLKECTIYVSLEPCSHFGKTPPCSHKIVEVGIKKVVIGCLDENPVVKGNGVKYLKEHNCEVIVGVLEKECQFFHRRFFTNQLKKRPYIILKWAESQDGFIAPLAKDEKKPVWISNPYSRILTHKWRTEEHAILVGKNTVIEDNPSLTSREYYGRNPIRFTIDLNDKLNTNYNLFNNDSDTFKITKDNISSESLNDILEYIYSKKIFSVIIEGGTNTLERFIKDNLWDEARIFTGNNTLNNGIKAPKLSRKIHSEKNILNDKLTIYIND